MGRQEKRVRIFSALEVANICGVVNQTAINWIKSEHLKAFTTPGGQYRVYAEDLIDFLEERKMRIPPELGSPSDSEANPRLILIIDDDKDLNTILSRMLQRRLQDTEILQAFDGFEAGRIIAERRPGLIILDFDLPGVNGLSLCRRIKSDPSIGRPSVISITGFDTESMRDELLQAGADDFFAKPLDFDGLIYKAGGLLQARAKRALEISRESLSARIPT
jgi:PleD family two-component response regulator